MMDFLKNYVVLSFLDAIASLESVMSVSIVLKSPFWIGDG